VHRLAQRRRRDLIEDRLQVADARGQREVVGFDRAPQQIGEGSSLGIGQVIRYDV
jgi:hypothetical protein